MNLKDYLQTSKNARKIFGKKEVEIILKQLSGMPLTQSEKNRISRDIKPKLEMIREMAAFTNEFELKKNQDNKRIISGAIDVLLNDVLSSNIKAILLFGSYADNSYNKRSDIDICVVFRHDPTIRAATAFRIRIAGQVSGKVDIHVFNILPQKIKKEIARNHRVLYKADDYDNINFSIQHLKDEDYFIRMKKIFGEKIFEAEA